MAILVHRYDAPDRFVAGTVGQPGERTFFLQAREGNRITSVACEKQQVSVLAEHLEALLALGVHSAMAVPLMPNSISPPARSNLLPYISAITPKIGDSMMAGAVKTVMISERAESLMSKGSVIAGKAG